MEEKTQMQHINCESPKSEEMCLAGKKQTTNR